MKPSVSNVVVALILLFAGYATGQSRYGPTQIVTVRDTLASQLYAREVQRHRIAVEGWRARLEAVESRPPERIVITDTVIPAPDTVFSFVSVRDGRVTSEALIRIGADSLDLRMPELNVGSDISDCDEGFEVSANGVVCDRAALGHLWVGPVLSMEPMLSAWWRPSYRSPWEVSVGFTGTEWQFGLRRGWKLF